jgi:hypothetical protein
MNEATRVTRIAAALVTGLLMTAASCETVQPKVKLATDVPSAGKFPHARLSLLYDKAVKDGLVDYAAVSVEGGLLEDYLAELARISPDGQPHLFPTQEDELAYWINAHNACAIRGVLRLNRPANLKDLGSSLDSIGFVLGGRTVSLSGIVALVRRRFHDPRVHFVLVRGRRGGPPLAQAPFEPADIDARLEAAARAFVADPHNVEWTQAQPQARFSHLILDFRGDFERLMPTTVSDDIRLIGAVNKWRGSGAKIGAASAVAIPFDTRLNDVANR